MWVQVNPEESRILQELCFLRGILWRDTPNKKVINSNEQVLHIRERISYSDLNYAKTQEGGVSFWEAVKRICDKIMIGQHDIHFKHGVIEIGCQKIPNKVVREIFEKLS